MKERGFDDAICSLVPYALEMVVVVQHNKLALITRDDEIRALFSLLDGSVVIRIGYPSYRLIRTDRRLLDEP